MTSAAIQLFGIPNCDTMKKARAWLKEHDIEYEFHDYKKAGLDKDTLRNWVVQVGWEILLNRRGTTWRKVPENIRDSIDENTAIDLMLESPSMIKRPVLITKNRLTVGFKPEEYASLFS